MFWSHRPNLSLHLQKPAKNQPASTSKAPLDLDAGAACRLLQTSDSTTNSTFKSTPLVVDNAGALLPVGATDTTACHCLFFIAISPVSLQLLLSELGIVGDTEKVGPMGRTPPYPLSLSLSPPPHPLSPSAPQQLSFASHAQSPMHSQITTISS